MVDKLFQARCLATAVGSMPHTDPIAACSAVLSHLSAVPAWPQLPKRSPLENMYAQVSEAFPGLVWEGGRPYVDRAADMDEPLGELYVAYLENQVERYAIGPEYAAGLHAFLTAPLGPAVAVKGQVTGPISWGLSVTDQDGRPTIYDDILADAIAKHLRLKAAWQEKALQELSPNTIIFLDEPYMASFGSAFVSLSRERVVAMLDEVFQGLSGLKGIHCCGNTDWSVLLETAVDILNLDAYSYAQTISLYPAEVRAFLDRGGIIAWGIVPSDETALSQESAGSLTQRLEAALDMLVRKGIPQEQIVEQSLITPSCGLATLSEAAAERALEITAAVSREMRQRYHLEDPPDAEVSS